MHLKNPSDFGHHKSTELNLSPSMHSTSSVYTGPPRGAFCWDCQSETFDDLVEEERQISGPSHNDAPTLYEGDFATVLVHADRRLCDASAEREERKRQMDYIEWKLPQIKKKIAALSKERDVLLKEREKCQIPVPVINSK